jgi:PAS domain S-box-containing protein
MDLPTLPRRTWLERVSIALAALLVLVGGAGIAGWWLQIDWLVQPWATLTPFRPEEAICFFALGTVLLLREVGWRQAGLLAIFPGAISCLILGGSLFNLDLHLRGLENGGNLFDTSGASSRVAVMAACCIALGAAALIWHALARQKSVRLFYEAVTGSALTAVGSSTLAGYSTNLSTIYDWGSSTPISPFSALCILLLGLALLLVAWRANVPMERGPPAWVPAPAIIGCLTLTLILWLGLHERERTYLDDKTQAAMGRLVGIVGTQIINQTTNLKDLAREWTDTPYNNPEGYSDESRYWMQRPDNQGNGCIRISYVNVDSWDVQEVFPDQIKTGNLKAPPAVSSRDPAAQAAAQTEALARYTAGHLAFLQDSPKVAATVSIAGTSQDGFVIYAPVASAGGGDAELASVRPGTGHGAPAKVVSLVAAEFAYQPFFKNLVSKNDFKPEDYGFTIMIGQTLEYAQAVAATEHNSKYTLTLTEDMFDGNRAPMTISFTPTDSTLATELRSMPEFALAAGFFISALLGWSLHLWRRAGAGQRAAELSNARLRAENEERRRVETRLKISDERLRLALDSTQIGVFEWNVPTGEVYYGAGLWIILGYDPTLMPATLAAWQSLIHADDLPVYRDCFESQVSGGAAVIDLEYRVRSRAGEWRWVYVRSKSVDVDATGRPTRIIGTVQDVTARVETEHHLRRAKTEADAASQAKSDFLASMSHEIRTPMNGVIGMTSLLMETPLTAEQRDFVNTVRSSGEALLTIINDILDFSKIESGKMELEHVPFDLTLCLEEALDLFVVPASAKGLEIGYYVAPDVPTWINGDVTRLRQVVVNLVNNAVKFTPKGSISVEVRRQAGAPVDAAKPERFPVEFTVRDTGIGISPEGQERLFKAFSQVDSSTTRKYGGTGLGLAISMRLSQLMGGGIRVESTAGHGSAFIFSIQTEAAPARTDIEYFLPLPAPLRQGTVLCVESHPVTLARVQTLFERWGAKCLAAPDTHTALQLTSALAEPPVLLVVGGGKSPDASPLDALAHLPCPRLVMVPFGQTPPTPRQNGLPFGSVAKPLKNVSFMQAVAGLFAPVAAEGPVEPTTKYREPILGEEFPLNVLLAEDNHVNQKVALRFLERMGYRADAVGNGLEVIAALETHRYDLVLMDLQMPEMDGLEATRQIRKRLPHDRQPKIIALTANAMQGDREICVAAGMDDYISKPVKLNEIAAVIRRQFGNGAKASKAVGA